MKEKEIKEEFSFSLSLSKKQSFNPKFFKFGTRLNDIYPKFEKFGTGTKTG